MKITLFLASLLLFSHPVLAKSNDHEHDSPAANKERLSLGLCRITTDDNADGTIEKTCEITFDKKEWTETHTCERDVKNIETIIYDENYRRLMHNNMSVMGGVSSKNTMYIHYKDGRVHMKWHSSFSMGCIIYERGEWSENFEYDSKGRVTLEEERISDNDYFLKKLYFYNKNGDLFIQKEMIAEGLKSTTFYYYDRDQKLIAEKKDSNADGHVDEVTSYKYKKDFKSITTSRYNGFEDPSNLYFEERKNYYYRSDGQIFLEETDTDADGFINDRIDFLFDSEGRVIEKIMIGFLPKKKIFERKKYFYDCSINP